MDSGEELILQKQMHDSLGDYMTIAVVEPYSDDEPVSDYWVANDEVLPRLCNWATLLIAERTPRPELIVSLAGDLDPVTTAAVVAALRADEAA